MPLPRKRLRLYERANAHLQRGLLPVPYLTPIRVRFLLIFRSENNRARLSDYFFFVAYDSLGFDIPIYDYPLNIHERESRATSSLIEPMPQ